MSTSAPVHICGIIETLHDLSVCVALVRRLKIAVTPLNQQIIYELLT